MAGPETRAGLHFLGLAKTPVKLTGTRLFA